MRDTLHVVMSDMHTGSIYALTCAEGWQGQKTAVIHPTSLQQRIRNHFVNFASVVSVRRKGLLVRLVIDGDLIDGVHHASGDVFTSNWQEMADLNIGLISEFQKAIGWQRGDELYITKGTEVHSGDLENYIGQQCNAQMNGDWYAHDLLVLNTNNVISWFVHHGPAAGKGANVGNGMVNHLRNIYYSCLKSGEKVPDILYTGHVHDPIYSTYTHGEQNVYRTMHGIILPSWQAKTRYAHMVAPVSVNKIGGITQLITAAGLIGTPQFCVMET